MLDDIAEAINEVLPHVMAATGTPGVAVALATSTELRTVAGGYADLARRVPMTCATVAPAGSLSKPVLGLGLMQVAESGDIDLDAPIDEFLPPGTRTGIPMGGGPVSSVMLASHQGGYRIDTIDALLTPPGPINDYVRERHAVGRTREYGGVASLFVEPGVYSYSSFGMSLMGCAMERVTGQQYASYVDQMIFKSAEMYDSAFPTGSSEPSRWGDLSAGGSFGTGYMSFGGWCVPTPTFHSGTYPAAGLLTSPADYARLLQRLLRTAHGQDGIVTPAGLARMLTPRIARSSPVTSGETAAGIAFELGDRRLGEDWWWGHSAAYPWGYWWDARVYPHRDLVVVALGNKWDMMRYANPIGWSAPGIVSRLVGRWVAAEMPSVGKFVSGHRKWPDPSTLASGWMGAIAGERIYGTLGVSERLAVETVREMIQGARPVGETDPSGWDGAAFERCFDAMAGVAPDPDAIARFVDGEGLAAGLWALECGASSADFPMPIDGFARPQQRRRR